MDWIKKLLGIAPTVATALGGPFAGAAATFVLDKLGVTSEGDPVFELENQLKKNPELMYKMKELDIQYKALLIEKGITLEEISYKDRDSARRMQMSVRSVMPSFLTIIITLAFLTLVFMFALGKFNPDIDANIMFMLIGSLNTAFAGSWAFYFGNTRGVNDKDFSIINKK